MVNAARIKDRDPQQYRHDRRQQQDQPEREDVFGKEPVR